MARDLLLQTFSEVVRQGSLTHAAQALGVKQTTATHRIRLLESEFGTTLFVRSRRGMELTEDGHAVLRYVQSAAELEGTLLASLRGSSTVPNKITIAGASAVIKTRVAPKLRDLLRAFPNLRVQLNCVDSINMMDVLRRGEAHCVISPVHEVTAECDSKVLRPMEYFLYGPKEWENWDLREVIDHGTILDFDPSDRVTFRYLEAHGHTPPTKERYFANDAGSIATWISQGIGYSALAAESAYPWESSGDIVRLNEQKPFCDELALVWYPRPSMPDWFRATIKSIH